MSYQLEVLQIADVTVKLRPRTLLTDEIQRVLRMDCLTALAETDGDDNLLAQPILDEFGIEEADIIYMSAYLWILSARVASITGADFEFIKRSDTSAMMREKVRLFMMSAQTDLVKAIDAAIGELDKPFDAELAPDAGKLSDGQKKTGRKSKTDSTAG